MNENNKNYHGFSASIFDVCKISLRWIAIILFFIYVALGPLSHEQSLLQRWIIIITLVSLCLEQQAKKLLHDPICWCLLLALLSQSLTWLVGKQLGNGYFSNPFNLSFIGSIFLFVAVAHIVKANKYILYGAFLVAVVQYGYLTMLKDGMLSQWLLGFSGSRVDFAVRNAQHTSMIFGSLLISACCLYRQILSMTKSKVVNVLVFTTLLIFSFSGCVITQTRAIYLALLFSIGTFVVLYLTFKLSDKKSRLVFISSLLTIAIVGGFFSSGILEHRVNAESDVVSGVIEGGSKDIPYTSIGVRLNTWLEALSAFEKRPITGWGEKARKEVIKNSTILPDWVKHDFGHLHNYFIEVTLSFGLLGLSSVIAMFIVLITRFYKRIDGQDGDFMLLGVAFCVYFIIANNFESYLTYDTGKYVFSILIGSIYSLVLYENPRDIKLGSKNEA